MGHSDGPNQLQILTSLLYFTLYSLFCLSTPYFHPCTVHLSSALCPPTHSRHFLLFCFPFLHAPCNQTRFVPLLSLYNHNFLSLTGQDKKSDRPAWTTMNTQDAILSLLLSCPTFLAFPPPPPGSPPPSLPALVLRASIHLVMILPATGL